MERQLFPTFMVLPDRGSLAHPFLLSRPSLSLLILALCEHSHRTAHSWFRPTRQWNQFYVVDPCWFRISVGHEAVPFSLVDSALSLAVLSKSRLPCPMGQDDT